MGSQQTYQKTHLAVLHVHLLRVPCCSQVMLKDVKRAPSTSNVFTCASSHQSNTLSNQFNTVKEVGSEPPDG